MGISRRSTLDLHDDGGAVDLVQPWVALAAVENVRDGRHPNHPAVHRPVDQRLDRGVGEGVAQQAGLVGVERFAREEQQSHVRVGLARAQDALGELGHGRHRGEDHAGLELDDVRLHGLQADVARDGDLDGARRQVVDRQDVHLHAAPGQALGELLAHAFQLAAAVEGDLRVRRGMAARLASCLEDDAIGLLGCEDLAIAASVALPEGCVVDHGNVAK
ncbi:hypothetical protein PG994_008943 [Apiospora phragmitis]|uniref:Uncharacterized protein n=1 Tax=Apiospora phragmitis TaxID=2905665 RepID=A0ABR1UHV7_9PEZI